MVWTSPCRLRGVAAGSAQLGDLAVRAVQVAGGSVEQGRDAEGFELADEALDVVAHHDKVGPVPGDGPRRWA